MVRLVLLIGAAWFLAACLLGLILGPRIHKTQPRTTGRRKTK